MCIAAGYPPRVCHDSHIDKPISIASIECTYWYYLLRITDLKCVNLHTIMAAPSKPVGYECEFVDEVAEELFCRHCKHVARRASIVNCCGETFCEECIQYEEPCPVDDCQQQTTQHIVHKKYVSKILALKVYCSLKDRGCEWTGQLQHLDAHLDFTTGGCVYIDVDCPNKCNQKVQKLNMDTHLADHCPNRQQICEHCSLETTYQELSQHHETCHKYPLRCPNSCGCEAIERQNLEDHENECPLQRIHCEFRQVGCGAEFIRDDQKEHMEQNTQKHLALVAAATLRIRNLEQKLQEQQEKFEQMIQQFEQKFERQEEQIKMLHHDLKAKLGLVPLDITVPNYEEDKQQGKVINIDPLGTHPGGYKYRLSICLGEAHFGKDNYISVKIYSITIKAGFKMRTTLQLLNQHRDQNHHTKHIECSVTRNWTAGDMQNSIGEDNKFIAHADLNWNENKQTQFLKNDCLKFRIVEINTLCSS